MLLDFENMGFSSHETKKEAAGLPRGCSHADVYIDFPGRLDKY